MGENREIGHAEHIRQQRGENTHSGSYYPPYTLKIRGGCDTYMKPDGSIGTAGKGALIQVDISATLGASQDQYLFVPMEKEDGA